MLKPGELLKFEHEAIEALTALFDRIPIVRLEGVHMLPGSRHDLDVDAVFNVLVGGQPYALFCELKTNGHPRATRQAVEQLSRRRNGRPGEAALFVAPYISESARDICVDADVNYFDLHGNYRIFLGSLFIEGSTGDKPAVEKRDLKSLFKPKSARILRWLLRDPDTPMRLKDIAEGARVSLGQVHNVKEGLIVREWAETTPDGVVLTDPDSLVDAWREDYEQQPGETHHYYTILHGAPLIGKLKGLMAEARREPLLALRSYSAADWLAPYGRSETILLYAWPTALPALERELALQPMAKGANVQVHVLDEESVLLDAVEAAGGLLTTSPVQTYLDLYSGGDRGREAAAFLRQKGFAWPQ
jgi:hypothetical protein